MTRGSLFASGAKRSSGRRARRVELAVFETDAGVLETPDGATRVDDGLWLARAWTCRRDGGAASLEAILDLWSAPDVERAMEAASRLAITANWLFSAKDGRIGAQQSGLLPRRRRETGLLPLRGWEPGDLWDGTLPPSALARLLDPPEGRPRHRERRGPRRLEARSASRSRWGATGPTASASSSPNAAPAAHALTTADLGEMQADVVSGQARRLLAALDPFLPDLPAVRFLRAWDRRYDAASKGAVLFEKLYAALCEELFGEGLFGAEAWRALRDTSLVHPFYFRLFDDVLAREDGRGVVRRGRKGRVRRPRRARDARRRRPGRAPRLGRDAPRLHAAPPLRRKAPARSSASTAGRSRSSAAARRSSRARS